MDYYIFSYAIDVNQVIQSFGSKNSSLLENIQKEPLFKNYNLQNTNMYVSLEDAAYHIIYDKPYREKSGSVYWYAFITICGYFSKELPYSSDILLGWQTDLCDELMVSELGVDLSVPQLLLNEEGSFNLPRVGVPMFGLVSYTKMMDIAKLMNRVNIEDVTISSMFKNYSSEDDCKAIAYETIKGLKENVDFCCDKKYSLVSFCH